MDQVSYEKLERIFGREFLAYVFNLQHVDELDDAPRSLNSAQLAVLQTLEQIRTTNEQGEGTPEGFAWAARLGIDRYIPGKGALANVLRQHAGGELWQPKPSSDPVLSLLRVFLVDCFPTFLLPTDRIEPAPSATSIVFNHDERPQLDAAVLADPVLSKLFTDQQDGGAGPSGWVVRSTGQGSGLQLYTFASQQIAVAYAWASLDTLAPPIDEVAEKLETSIATIRKAIQGKTVSVPMRVGLTGALLPPSMQMLDVGWARLRVASESDRQRVSNLDIGGKLQTTATDGSTVEIDYAGDIVACIDVHYRLLLGEPSNTVSNWPPELQSLQRGVAEDIDSLRLALALVESPTNQPMLIVPTWQLTIDPLATSALPGWNDARRISNLVPTQLDESQAASWESWSRRIKEHRQPSVAVSVRRILSALGERRNDEDVLVDAVVVWENLFGTNQETTNRVATALAWLLGKDAVDRASIQKNCKRLYGLRSSIVHGSSKIKQEDIPKAARETINIAIEALRVLFETRPDLLPVVSSEARGNKLMLDEPYVGND